MFSLVASSGCCCWLMWVFELILSNHHVGPESPGEPVLGWLDAGKKWSTVCTDSTDGPGSETLGWGRGRGNCCSFEDPDEKVSFLPSAQMLL